MRPLLEGNELPSHLLMLVGHHGSDFVCFRPQVVSHCYIDVLLEVLDLGILIVLEKLELSLQALYLRFHLTVDLLKLRQ